MSYLKSLSQNKYLGVIEALMKMGGVGTRLLLLPSLDETPPNTCSGLDDDDDDNSVPGRGGGRIKPATAVVIWVISSCESLDNPAEEDVSMVGADVVGKLDAGVSSAIPHVQDKHRRSTDRVACCHVSLHAKKLVDS